MSTCCEDIHVAAYVCLRRSSRIANTRTSVQKNREYNVLRLARAIQKSPNHEIWRVPTAVRLGVVGMAGAFASKHKDHHFLISHT